MQPNQQIIEILMAEDSPTDAELTQEAIKSSKLPSHLYVVTDGEEALAFLRREGAFATVPVPDLILLDVNMPRKNGLEALAAIKQHPDWKYIPVVMLTSSQAERDIITAYENHTNCYIVKPVDFDRFIDVVRAIENFWFSIVTLPPQKHDESYSPVAD
jgi:chemotaxis family two-component system response regulator Rcp1